MTEGRNQTDLELKEVALSFKGYSHEDTEALFEMVIPVYYAGSSGVLKEPKYKIIERVTGREVILQNLPRIL